MYIVAAEQPFQKPRAFRSLDHHVMGILQWITSRKIVPIRTSRLTFALTIHFSMAKVFLRLNR